MLMGHKIALDPTNKQRTYFAKACGVARFAYNWALTKWEEQYKAHKEDSSLPRPSDPALRRLLNSIKAVEFPWMLEVTKNAPQMAIIHLGKAFKNFFEGRANRPTYRRKGVDDSFTLTNDQFKVDGKRIHIPKLGWVRMRESLRFEGKIMSATISRTADRWFVSINVDVPDLYYPKAESQGDEGMDLGLITMATLSSGEKIEGPKPLRRLLKKLRRLNKSLSRKQKGSKNWKKAKAKIARLYARIANVRKDASHKMTTDLTSRFDVVAMEDLNVKGMMKMESLARSASDVGLGEIRRQMLYKGPLRGCTVILVDRFYPSSKLCSVCQYKNDSLKLSDREWECPICRSLHDRDINAATNLRNKGRELMVSACGAGSAGSGLVSGVKLTAMKQEPGSSLSA